MDPFEQKFFLQTRLEDAIKDGDLGAVCDCLADGASPNYRVGSQSPLCQAILKSHHSIITCLLEHGADISFDDSDPEGLTPEMKAYQHTIEAYELLITDSLGVKNTTTWVGIAIQGIVIPLAKGLAKTIITRTVAERQLLYPMFIVKRDGPNVLEAVQQFNDPRESDMLTLLKYGIFPRFVPARPDLTTGIRAAVESALDFAISNGHVKVVKEILNLGIDINIPLQGRRTPLYLAIEHLNIRITKLLLDRGADLTCLPYTSDGDCLYTHSLDEPDRNPIFQVLPDPEMPTHKAETCLNMMSLLLDAGTDVNIRTDGGKTLLAAAVENKSAAATCFLLSRGADANLEDYKGRIPLQLPVYSAPYTTEIVRLLIPNTRNINHLDHEGKTPLIDLVRNNSNFESVKLLLEADASSGINIVSTVGTALQNATWWVTEEMLSLLLDAGADPNIIGGQYQSALMSVASVNSRGLPLIRILLEHGADATYADATGNTALHEVIESMAEDKLESAKLLIQHGANVNAARRKGGRFAHKMGEDTSPVTPLALVIQESMVWRREGRDLAELLVENAADTSLLSSKLREELERLIGDAHA